MATKQLNWRNIWRRFSTRIENYDPYDGYVDDWSIQKKILREVINQDPSGLKISSQDWKNIQARMARWYKKLQEENPWCWNPKTSWRAQQNWIRQEVTFRVFYNNIVPR